MGRDPMRGMRGARDNPVSFFAFQDIMTGVIGILLLIVLLMCLDLSRATAEADGTIERLQAARLLEHDLDSILAQEKSADLSVRELQSQLRRQAGDRPQIDRVVARRRELSRLYERIAGVERALHGGFEALRELTENGGALRQLEELIENERTKKRLESELDAARRHQGLTYLLNQRFKKIPLLVVASRDAIRVGIVGSEQAVLTFRQRNLETRKQAVAQWLQRFDSQGYYVLLVAKPSAQGHVGTLRTMITELGFSQGLDLLPEDWSVLQYSPFVGGGP